MFLPIFMKLNKIYDTAMAQTGGIIWHWAHFYPLMPELKVSPKKVDFFHYQLYISLMEMQNHNNAS